MAQRHPNPARRRGTLAAITVVVVMLVGLLVNTANAATVFTANFESGGTSGWSKSGGDWAVVADGSSVARQSKTDSEHARLFAGDTGWTNYSVQARVKPLAFGGSGFAALAARATGSTTMYRLALLSGGRAELQAVRSGAVTVLGGTSLGVSTGTWYTLRIVASGSTITGFVNGTQIGSGSSSVAGAGRIGLVTVLASASFDDVTVDSDASTPPTTTRPGTTTTTRPGTTTTTTRPGTTTTTRPPTGSWPTPTGSQGVGETIEVSGTFDGGMRRYFGTGDLGSGGQDEGQDPIFRLAAGATLQNVILGAPAADGVHCAGNCTLRNVWWEDVGEDAATFRGGASTSSLVDGGGAQRAEDKVFQHNGGGTVTIRNFHVRDFGKLYRSCGNCSTQMARRAVIQNVRADAPGETLAGINVNFGDSASFSNNTVASGIDLCWSYQGTTSGEPTKLSETC